MSKKMLEKFLFPYGKIREQQNELVSEVCNTIKKGGTLIAHAPTGLGKTAATLGPALAYALENNKTIFFLTSRHTQHIIAIETLKDIKKKYEIEFGVADMIGKKWMCLMPNARKLLSGDFFDYCKSVVDANSCEFYTNFKNRKDITQKAQKLAEELRNNVLHTEELIEQAADAGICPYEIASLVAKDAKVVVSDYYYIFNPSIRASFLNRIGRQLSDCIIIVDEAHNLPGRIRDLLTENLSNFMLRRAITEAKKFHYVEAIEILSKIQDILNELSEGLEGEKLVTKEDFTKRIEHIGDYGEIVGDFEFMAETIRKRNKLSYLGSIARFMEFWQERDEGFVRMITAKQTARGEHLVMLSHRCLDPSLETKDVVEAAHSIICMSGTLTPAEMYKDVLGFDKKTELKDFKSPFPQKNRLNIIVPETTTKYSKRNKEQFKRIAEITADIVNSVPGNSVVFFPSYRLRDAVDFYFSKLARKTLFLERPKLSKKEKSDMLSNFKKYKDSGAVLLAAVSGSFGESIDLPGDLLKCVVVVGLPLNPPDLETTELINYYDRKYGKGWDYGYVFPAITKCMQSAGRCIRSEKDRGVIVFLDERFALQNYFRCFPKDYDVSITKDYRNLILDFFRS